MPRVSESTDVTKALAILGITPELVASLPRDQRVKTVLDVVTQTHRTLARRLHPDAGGRQELFDPVQRAFDAIDGLGRKPGRFLDLLESYVSGAGHDSKGDAVVLEVLTIQARSTNAELQALRAFAETYIRGCASGLSEKGGFNILAPGSFIFRVSELQDREDDYNPVRGSRRQQASRLVTLTTDSTRGIIKVTANTPPRNEFDHLIGAVPIGCIDRNTYSKIGRGPTPQAAPTAAVRLSHSGGGAASSGALEGWEIERETFTHIVLPNLSLQVSEGCALVLMKDGNPARYYVTFEIGMDSTAYKGVNPIEHNPLR